MTRHDMTWHSNITILNEIKRFGNLNDTDGQIFLIGTVHYAEGLWRMCRQGPVIAHSTDLEDFPTDAILPGLHSWYYTL